jgi:hypothetical protein
MVGGMTGSTYLVNGALSRTSLAGTQPNAIRTDVDVMPADAGRTDLTGVAVPGVPPFVPPLPAAGGTTPFACLAPLGQQIGQPAPLLNRMLIDWSSASGQVQPGNNVLVVDKPPPTAVFASMVIQFGFPNPTPVTIPGAVEVWVSPNVNVGVLAPTSGPLEIFLWLPPGPGTFSVQVLGLLTTPLAASCGGSSVVATPGLHFSY